MSIYTLLKGSVVVSFATAFVLAYGSLKAEEHQAEAKLEQSYCDRVAPEGSDMWEECFTGIVGDFENGGSYE